MTTAIQPLNVPWYITTPLGNGWAHAIIDYGPWINPVLIFAHEDTREMVCVDLCECKMGGNAMYNAADPVPFKERNI